MKRFLLIAAGTVGGLGAVLSITPPQLGASDLGLGFDTGALPTSGVSNQTPVASQTTPATVATKAPTKPSPTKSNQSATNSSVPTKTSSTSSTSSTPIPAQTQSTTPSIVPTPPKTATPTPTSNSLTGVFSGPIVNVSYGNVQVQITVTNGKITDAQALIAPTGKNDKYTRMALPQLREQTLAAQSTTIQGASGASYTTYGWRKSLQGAMAKAGL